jgi:hypothetical protein
VKRLRRIPGTVHEKTNVHCEVIKEFTGVGSRSCVNLCLKRLHDVIVSRPLKLNLNVSGNGDSIDFSSINLCDVFRSLRSDLIFKDKGESLVVLHPCHTDSTQDQNGVIWRTHSYCHSTMESFNFFETVKLLLGADNNAIVMKYLVDNWS